MVRLILNGRCIDDEQADPLPHDFCLPGGRVALSPGVLPLLREVVGVAGLTTEDLECALIWRRLEEAQAAGVIHEHHHAHHETSGYQTTIHWRTAPHESLQRTSVVENSRLAAEQAALAHVETLEAEARKVPDPDDMAIEDVRDELRGRAWRFGFNADRLFWQNASGFCVYMQDDETRCQYERRALRRARELAQQA